MNESLYLNAEDYCAVECNDRRFYMAVAGTILSFVSLFCNVLIAKVLYSSNHKHFFFLALLAISDSFLSFMYGPVIAMDIIKDKLQILWLTRFYLSYVGPLLSLCQVSMTFSCYLIMLATIERYLITQRSKCLKRFRRNRGLMAFIMFLLSLLLRGTLVFEIQMDKNGDCTGISEYVPGFTEIVDTMWYGTVFRFYIRNILTVFLPFFLLAYLNYRIVRTLRRQHRMAKLFRIASDHKRKIRSATRLLVLIVCSYLIANVLNVLITLWEYVAFQSTQTQEAYVIYEFCTDVISVLYVLVCATRLFVYITCNMEIRDAMVDQLCSKRTRKKGKDDDDYCSRKVVTDADAVEIAVTRHLFHFDVSRAQNGDGNNSLENSMLVKSNTDKVYKTSEIL
ncbi:hypothetical protein KIN20_010546 [Parelaphostrongylus tenuis]|uniref:G-protein coupled receptors family 1 profile domain-containing protein n=1 Tax=Parelaphostrongylus tenuis TaxID=148309 RepID=A0AAD5QKA7_PARTN|nr:hypothetical protein KIN20_010546 [Parelaphostrongylus tenuis]